MICRYFAGVLTLSDQPVTSSKLYTVKLLQYTAPFQDKGNISALTTWSYTGERFADIGNVPYAVIPAFDRWDFRASWESPSRTWDVTFYVQNIADKIGIQE